MGLGRPSFAKLRTGGREATAATSRCPLPLVQRRRQGRSMLRLLGLMLCALSVGGGLSGCRWLFRGRGGAFGPGVPCRLSPGMTLSQWVDTLNANIGRVYAWKSADVKIHARGMPGALSAQIAVESPRNFRLVAQSLTGIEADLGSNPERFWFWMRRSDVRRVLFARHDQMHRVRNRLAIPFQPDWLMEVLGVIPFDEEELTLERSGPASETVRLVAQRLSPTGRPVRKVTVVDACHGRILEHALYDADGTRIARAVLDDHRLEADTGVILPHRITLEWPQAGLHLTIRIGRVEVNPAGGIPAQVWAMPEIPGYPPLDLGAASADPQSTPLP